MKLGLSSPWARQAIPPADRDAIEALIPDGWRIVVTSMANYGGHRFSFFSYRPDGALVSTWQGRYDAVEAATEMALGQQRITQDVTYWQLRPDMTVTVPLVNEGEPDAAR